MLNRMRSQFTPEFLLATVLCAGIAFGMSILCRNSAAKGAVPVAILLTLAPVAYLVGRRASLVVAIVACFVFAMCLFPPYGSLFIHSKVDGIELLCFGLAAVAVVHFSPGRDAQAKTPAPRHASHAPLSSASESSDTLEVPNQLETWIAVVGYAVAFLAIVTILLYIW